MLPLPYKIIGGGAVLPLPMPMFRSSINWALFALAHLFQNVDFYGSKYCTVMEKIAHAIHRRVFITITYGKQQ